jgi:NADPH:quinone reductase-like Zn-dependent oxidoreductase
MTMRAAVLHRHGAPPEPGQHRAPQRAAGEALIRVTAAPINPLDLLCASGTSYFGPPALPYVPGTQGVGVVAESDTLPAGQRVWFSAAAGMRPGDGSMRGTRYRGTASARGRQRRSRGRPREFRDRRLDGAQLARRAAAR